MYIISRFLRGCFLRFYPNVQYNCGLGSSDFTVRVSYFSDVISTLSTLVVALGAGLAVWGVINLLEGYGNDNPGAKSQGIKQLMSGGGVILIGLTVIPLLSNLFG